MKLTDKQLLSNLNDVGLLDVEHASIVQELLEARALLREVCEVFEALPALKVPFVTSEIEGHIEKWDGGEK